VGRVDQSWLKERLERYLWRDNEIPGHVVSVEMVQSRRRYKEAVRSQYQVTLRGRDDKLVEQTYIGSRLLDAARRIEPESWLWEAAVVPPVGRSVVRIPEAGLELVALPNEQQVCVCAEAGLRSWLMEQSTLLANRGRRGPCWAVKDSVVRLVRYKRGRCVTLRCRGSFAAAGCTERPFAFIAKQFRNKKRAEALHRNLVYLGKHFANSSALLCVPRALTFDQKIGLVVMEEMPGKALDQVLDEVHRQQTMREVGRMLANLHQTPRRVRRSISRRMELAEVGRAAKTIRRVVPAVSARLDACIARCQATAWAEPVPKVMLHGAYRPNHLLVHEGRLAVIDVDGIRMGHPAYDLADFLWSLHYLAERNRISRAVRDLSARRFIEGYAAHAPWRLSPRAVLWFLATRLIHKQARRHVMHEEENRQEKVERVLTLTEAVLARFEELRDASRLETIWDVLG
jgi:aminoglycoside phosphotransferase (APT) family kinase protein